MECKGVLLRSKRQSKTEKDKEGAERAAAALRRDAVAACLRESRRRQAAKNDQPAQRIAATGAAEARRVNLR